MFKSITLQQSLLIDFGLLDARMIIVLLQEYGHHVRGNVDKGSDSLSYSGEIFGKSPILNDMKTMS